MLCGLGYNGQKVTVRVLDGVLEVEGRSCRDRPCDDVQHTVPDNQAGAGPKVGGTVHASRHIARNEVMTQTPTGTWRTATWTFTTTRSG